MKTRNLLFYSLTLFILAFLFNVTSLAAQTVKQDALNLITPNLIMPHLRFLSSDELEGRETGKHGQKVAARYIASVFERLGLKPVGDSGTYFQKFPVYESRLGLQNRVTVQSKSGTKVYEKFLKDFYLFGGGNDTVQGNVVFAGYGIDDSAGFAYSDYKKIHAKGKIVLVMGGVPQEGDSTSRFGKQETKWSYWGTKRNAARDAGAEALLIVNDLGKTTIPQQAEIFQDYILQGKMSLSQPKTKAGRDFVMVYISSEMANEILKPTGKTVEALRKTIDQTYQSNSFDLKETSITITQEQRHDQLESANVVGLLEGSDPKLKNEIVVYSAHYDHLGITPSGVVYNGADDDGSGTSTVLALAEAFVKSPVKPRRSILFITVAGEEKGLLGSQYYTEKPIFELSKTVCDLNIDMIGRIDAKHEKLGETDYTYVIGSDKISKMLDDILNKENKETVNIKLDYTFNDDNDPNRFYYRSDHYNFAKNDIPVIFFFTGVHADYHKPTDHFDKIDFKKMSLIAKLAFAVGLDVANRDDRLKLDVPKTN
jgi:hypothetical protein